MFLYKTFHQNGVNFLCHLALEEKQNLMTARVSMLLKSHASDMLPSLFPSWSGLGLISTQENRHRGLYEHT